jgi:hypothetical protein
MKSTDQTGNLTIARCRFDIYIKCGANVVGPGRSAHARIRWWVLQQLEVVV